MMSSRAKRMEKAPALQERGLREGAVTEPAGRGDGDPRLHPHPLLSPAQQPPASDPLPAVP